MVENRLGPVADGAVPAAGSPGEYERDPEPRNQAARRPASAATEPARNSTGWEAAFEAAVALAEQAASEAEEIAAGNNVRTSTGALHKFAEPSDTPSLMAAWTRDFRRDITRCAYPLPLFLAVSPS